MISRVATHLSAKRVAVLALLVCARRRLRVQPRWRRTRSRERDPLPGGASGACGPTVLEALSQVTQRVYDEGVSSERTEIAMRLIKGSRALREAVEHGDAGAARTAAQALLASGHLTNLTVYPRHPDPRRPSAPKARSRRCTVRSSAPRASRSRAS